VKNTILVVDEAADLLVDIAMYCAKDGMIIIEP
jgi:hypothetical protein